MKIKHTLLILLFTFQLSGCIPAVLGVTAATGVAIRQDRTLGSTVDDYTIWTKIKSSYLKNDATGLFKSIDVKVKEGQVLLIGHTSDAEVRVKAVQYAWEQTGVKKVINEIKLVESADKPLIKDYAIDTWITTQLKARLLLEKNINSVNYNIETLDKTVYLFGIAKTQEELETVSHLASITQYVEHVVSHVKLKEED